MSCQRWGWVSATQTPHSDMPPHTTLFCPCTRACPTAAVPLWTEWGAHLARVEFRRMSRATQHLPMPSCSQHFLQASAAGGLGGRTGSSVPHGLRSKEWNVGLGAAPGAGGQSGRALLPLSPSTDTYKHTQRKETVTL